MRVYVAAKWEDRARASELMNILRSCKHIITHDWTVIDQVTIAQAVADYNGVMTADALVLIAEKDLPYCGALVELGIALGRMIPTYVVGNALDDRCIFMNLPTIRRSFVADFLC